MVPLIARHLLYPVHERLLRRHTFRYLRGLNLSQWDSPDEIRDLQREKLRALLRHAFNNTAFYRRRFLDADIDVTRDEPMAALGRLPLLDKAAIRASTDDMVWSAAPGGVHWRNTGGSTGEPLVFCLDRRRQGYDQAARIRSHQWFGARFGDPELYLWGSPIEATRSDRFRAMRDSLINHRLLDAFNMSPSRMDRYLDAWDHFAPVCLFGYPSSIALLVDHARSTGRKPCTRRSRAVFVTGEVCYPHQRDTMRDYLGVPVADGYGSREAGFIAHECPEGRMHLTAENVIVEIVDGDGRPVSLGEHGEIIVTHLDAYAMPFIRYRTGDVGRLLAGRCTCGRGLPLMDVVQGRTTDFLRFRDGTVKHALSIIYPLRALRGLRQFHVTQAADFSVTVQVVADDRAEKITRETVARSVRPVIGDQTRLRVAIVDRIATTDSGKHRYVVSHATAVTEPFPVSSSRAAGFSPRGLSPLDRSLRSVDPTYENRKCSSNADPEGGP